MWRGLLGENSIALPKGAAPFRNALMGKLEVAHAKLIPLSQALFHRLCDQWVTLDEQIAYDDGKRQGSRLSVMRAP